MCLKNFLTSCRSALQPTEPRWLQLWQHKHNQLITYNWPNYVCLCLFQSVFYIYPTCPVQMFLTSTVPAHLSQCIFYAHCVALQLKVIICTEVSCTSTMQMFQWSAFVHSAYTSILACICKYLYIPSWYEPDADSVFDLYCVPFLYIFTVRMSRVWSSWVCEL